MTTFLIIQVITTLIILFLWRQLIKMIENLHSLIMEQSRLILQHRAEILSAPIQGIGSLSSTEPQWPPHTLLGPQVSFSKKELEASKMSKKDFCREQERLMASRLQQAASSMSKQPSREKPPLHIVTKESLSNADLKEEGAARSSTCVITESSDSAEKKT